MVAEVIGFLGGRGTVVDMTLGAGGHAEALLDAGVAGVVGVDRDPSALAVAARAARDVRRRFRLVRARFSEVDEDVVDGPVDGVLFDLGVSSMQLDDRSAASATARTDRSTCGWARRRTPTEPRTSSTSCRRRSSPT